MRVMDRHEGEVALELAVGLHHRLDQVAVVVALDQVRDDFGVGFGGEGVTVGLKRLFELAVVLDDPVEDDGDLALLAAGQRVRVLLGDPAVRRPAGVAETHGRIRPVQRGRGLQVREVADGADVVQLVVLTEHQAGGVVAAVLEPLEPLEEERLAGPGPDVTDDSAHLDLLRRWPA
jgi:hypothetical protein